MVSFTTGLSQYYGFGLGSNSLMQLNAARTKTSVTPKATTQPKTTTASKSLVLPRGITETSTGGLRDPKGNEVIRQGDKYYTVRTEADSAFGYITIPTLYQPPPVTKKERVEKKRVAIEQAVGSRTPIFEDLPQPEELPIETVEVPEDATPEQKEEARLKEEAKFREREQERQARRNQLRTFAGQRRSLLRPAARRPYYA
jgi:hypothetical protein